MAAGTGVVAVPGAWRRSRHGLLPRPAGSGGALLAACLGCLGLLWASGRLSLQPLLLRVLAVVFGLRKPRPGHIRRIDGVKIPGADKSVELATTLFVREGQGRGPTMLIRTPYDKGAIEICALAVASQGFHVVLQDCRGRYASSGVQTFAAFEDADGVATVDWLARQGYDWYDPEKLVMFGISYLGIVQWALVSGLKRRQAAAITEKGVAADQAEEASARPEPKQTTRLVAMAPLFSASRVFDIFFRNGSFRLDFYLRYLHLMTKCHSNAVKDKCLVPYHLMRFEQGLRRHIKSSMSTVDLCGKLGVPALFRYNPRPTSTFWRNRDYSDAIACAPPAFVATGWHDLMLESSLNDFCALVQAHGPGHSRLLVGPWHHLESVTSNAAFSTLLRGSIDFLQEQCGIAEERNDDLPVRLWIMGKRVHLGSWRSFSAWPPAETVDRLLLLGPGTLAAGQQQQRQQPQSRSRLTYNPMDPTPSHGGELFSPFQAGEKEQSGLLTRPDVLTFTGAPLTERLAVVGVVTLHLLLRTSRPYFDVCARLIDLHPNGKSFNVCDAALRRRAPVQRSMSHDQVRAFAKPEDNALSGAEAMDCELVFAPTAKTFEAGHRICLLISCGSFPRLARHFGDAEQALDDPLDVGLCELEVLHTDQLPSALRLPVLPQGTRAIRRKKSLTEAAVEAQAVPRCRLSPMAGHSPKDPCAGLRKIQSDAVMGPFRV